MDIDVEELPPEMRIGGGSCKRNDRIVRRKEVSASRFRMWRCGTSFAVQSLLHDRSLHADPLHQLHAAVSRATDGGQNGPATARWHAGCLEHLGIQIGRAS